MQNYNSLTLQYQNPNGPFTSTEFKLGQVLKLTCAATNLEVTGTLVNIYRDEEEEQDNCYPQCYNLQIEDSTGKLHTINYNMSQADEEDPQWFYNENFYADYNNSVQVIDNTLSVTIHEAQKTIKDLEASIDRLKTIFRNL